MQPNPFLTALKIGVFAILCFLVWISFQQQRNVEKDVNRLVAESAASRDRLNDVSRKVDALASKADQVQGAADAMAQMMASGGVRVGEATASSGTAPVRAGRKDWGWERNAGLDAAVDPSRPAGTPGRYKNFLELDPDPVYPPRAKAYDQSVVAMVLGSQQKTFNPLLNTGAPVAESIENYVADAAAAEHWEDPYKYAPSLCWRVEVSPDYREYTLFFRRDVKWQQPADPTKYPHLTGDHPFTARDFKFTVDTILNPQTETARMRAYFGDVEAVEVLDDWTAIVRWKKTVYHSIAFTLNELKPVPEFLYGFDETGTRFPPETFGQQFNDHYYNRVGMLGCGPYRMLSYDGGEWLTLERDDDWYGVRDGRRPLVKTTRLFVYNDPEAPFLKLKAGEISILGLTPSHWKKHVRDETDPKSPFKDGTFVNYRGLRPAYYYFGWRHSHHLFTDIRVRKALALAFDRDAILEKIWLDYLVPMAGPIFPGSPSADPDLKPAPHDPAEAARLLDEAGWKLNPESGVREKIVDGETKRFEFKMVWNAPQAEIEATINQYRNDLRALGIVLTPEPLEWSIYLEKLHDRAFEASMGSWATNSWDMDFEQIWHGRQADVPKSSNYIEYRNAEVDRLSDELRVEMDVEKRKEKARKVGRLIAEDYAVCFVGWVNVYGAHWNWLHGAIDHAYKTRPFIRTTPMWAER